MTDSTVDETRQAVIGKAENWQSEAGPTGSDWRALVAVGSFPAALAAFHASGADPELRFTLEELNRLAGLLRARSWVRARRVLDGIDPAERGDWLDWSALEAGVQALREAAEALDLRETERALELLDRIDLGVLAAETANLRGAALIFQGDTDTARAWFVQAVELDPRHYRAVTNIGNAALEAGDADEAISWYEKALELNGDFPNAHHNLGVAYRRKGRIAQSIKALKAGQKAQQRFDQTEAREQLGSIGSGASRKYGRWLLYGAGIAGVYWFLSSRGVI